MELILLLILVIVTVLMIGFILVQRSDNDGFGMGSGGGGGLMSSRGQANFMTRTTAILAFIFMAGSLLLSVITVQGQSDSLIDEIVAEQEFRVPVDGVEIKEEAPEAEETQQPTTEPSAPAAQ